MRIESNNAMNIGVQRMPIQGMDGASKNIQNQIQNKQQELQKLSENEDMSLEEKMKKRQSIQQEIADLNMQLRQHQIEQRKEQQSKGTSMDDMLGGKQQVQKKTQNGQSAGLSQASMTALISADSSMKQAKVQGNVATQMQGRANVLKAEIKQSGSTEAKEAELADVEQKAVNATADQMNTISDANKAAQKAAEAGRESGKAESSKDKKTKEADGKQKKVADDGKQDEDVQNVGISEASKSDGVVEVSVPETLEVSAESVTVSGQGSGTYVDVRL